MCLRLIAANSEADPERLVTIDAARSGFSPISARSEFRQLKRKCGFTCARSVSSWALRVEC